jgi:hypothetical protein
MPCNRDSSRADENDLLLPPVTFENPLVHAGDLDAAHALLFLASHASTTQAAQRSQPSGPSQDPCDYPVCLEGSSREERVPTSVLLSEHSGSATLCTNG